jgi:sulfate/thiosulfate transport system ATP-binding protein
VALARALAIEPGMLLLDEPFGALDAKVRRELRHWLRRIHDETGVTTVFVTHDQEEALDLADRVAILKDGHLVQVGAPQEVYEHPATAFVYDFLGASCRLPGEIAPGGVKVADWTTAPPADAPASGKVEVFFRPHEVEILPPDQPGVSAVVRAVALAGAQTRVECLVGDDILELQSSGGGATPDFVGPGKAVRLRPSRPKVYAIEG